ncbi:IucA/IucC family siderophore biosynthesis protein [Nitratireductor sp. OM-1]|uniref:IucA/IucC family protein n=1 Tax=Nitratireductor sp. OM-1 TaxID=1756988 RepID=UPI000DE0A0E7|nr:IucA/IucC family protein [Nitratireductor sp. OM-1]
MDDIRLYTAASLDEAPLRENAVQNALRRLIRCLFAEGLLDPAALQWAGDRNEAELPLWPSRRVLHFADLRRAPAGTLRNFGPIELVDAAGVRARIEHPVTLVRAIAPSLAMSPAANGITHLLRDIENSMANDILARRYRADWSAGLRRRIDDAKASGLLAYLQETLPPHLAAMFLDQWGALEGHPFYPTWKARPGLSAEDVEAFSPEFGARVPVRIAALRRDWAYVERMPHVGDYSDWFAQNFPDCWRDWSHRLEACGQVVTEWIPLPIHAWHLTHFVRHEFADEIARGVLDPEGPDLVTLPSMSFRTMLPETHTPRPFIKLPVAIWMTSEQRTLQAKSIHMGPRLSAMIREILMREGEVLRDRLDIFTEELGAILRDPETGDEHPGRFLSVVYRNTDVLKLADGQIAVAVAALLAESPLDGRPLICELIARGDEGGEGDAGVEAFFRSYARTIIEPVLTMYLLYGIALEAHQQNSTILFDAAGRPRKLLIRDFGDGRSFAPLFEERGFRLKPFVREGILPTTFDEDIGPVRSFLIDACFVCHLHEIALTLTDHYELRDTGLWRILREEAESVFDALRPRMLSDAFWQRERAAFLEEPWPTRSVLRMHLERYRDYRAEHTLPNPLAEAQ